MDLLTRAIEIAARAHRNQVRKGTDIPYISHPYIVGMMLAREGLPDNVVAAGILHDMVEDTYMTLEDIFSDFGAEIAGIVEGCSEPDKSLSWEERKRHTLDHLRHASWEVRTVSCADKLHNARSTRAEYERYGDAVWSRFKRGRAEQEWYYRSLVEVLCDGTADGRKVPFCDELREEVEKLFGA